MKDILMGGEGNDFIFIFFNIDFFSLNLLDGGVGEDILLGGFLIDIMIGGSGNDFLSCLFNRGDGGGGNDIIDVF